jgi:hypothetical protein
MKHMIHDDTAVSETLGYILLFGIALTAIAIILLVGNSIIASEKSKDNFQSIVQSFNILQSNMKQVALDGTPVKTTIIHMQGGTMAINTDAARLKVDYNSLHYNNSTGQIIFTKEDDLMNNVSIENGGVWEANDGYSFTVAPPRMYVTPQTNTLVLNVYRLTAINSSIANAGVGTMTVGMRYSNQSYVLPTEEASNGAAVLTLDTNYRHAWKEYLNNSLIGTNVVVTYDDSYPDGVKATLSPISKLIISEHWINLSISGLYA